MNRPTTAVLVLTAALGLSTLTGVTAAHARHGADDPPGDDSRGTVATAPSQPGATSGSSDDGVHRHRGRHRHGRDDGTGRGDGTRHHARHGADDGPGHHRHGADDGPNHT